MAWDLDHVQPPWDPARPAIYDFIRERLDDAGSLGAEPPMLPDEVEDPTTLSWSAGALDGVSRHFGVAQSDDEIVAAITNAVTQLAKRSTTARAARLYEIVGEHSTLEYVDRVLSYLGGAWIDVDRLAAIGRWLATRAPDRSAVKFGVALLGMVDPPDVDVFLTLGAHDEFTLYATVALLGTNAGDRALFDLAKRVHGWGRIEIVERLEDTTDPEIQHWMITAGYRNTVMYEYLAMTCATTGRLAAALDTAEIDDGLVTSAGELLSTIIAGMPGPPPGEYPDLVPALRAYLRHVSTRTGSLHDRSAVHAIRRFLRDPDDVDIAEDDRTELLAACETFLDRPHFRVEAERGLNERDLVTFGEALEAARDLDIDVFDALSIRIENEYDEHPQWYALLQATDASRLGRVLDLGRRCIDLAAIATGPSNAIGLGPGFEQHDELSWFLQSLVEYPGRGWDFVAAGLASPSVQNRNGAIRILQKWPRAVWPEGARAALEEAVAVEVNPDVRTFAEDVLRGDVSIEESWQRTMRDLAEFPDLAAVAERLSATGTAARLRAKASPFSFVVWNGTFDSDSWEGSFVTVGYTEGGLTVAFNEGRHGDRDATEGLTVDDAVVLAERLVRRLVMG